MNEHPIDRDLETARTVGTWLERTTDELPDNPTGRERLLDEVVRTSQRSARWLPPVFPGGIGTLFTAARLTAAAGIVIIFAGLLLMSILPRDDMAVVAPGTETASPSLLATEAPVLNASVTGHIDDTIDWGVPDDQRFQAPVGHWNGDTYTLRDEYHLRQVEWRDARLPPEMHVWVNRNEYVLDPASPSQRGGVSHGRVSLENDQGSWEGQLEGFFPRDERYATEWFTLTGGGGYDGLYAVLVAEHWYDTEAFEFRNEIVGLVAEGDPPPVRSVPVTDEGPVRATRVPVAQEEETDGAGTHVTGTLLDLAHDTSTETSDWKADVLEWRDWVTTFQYEWSDPRLPTEIRSYNNGNEYILEGRSASERGGHIRGTAVGHGPDGSWEGSFTGLYPDTIDDVRNWMVLTGSGGYEGLYAVITAHQWYDADAMENRHEVEALIAEGEPPPVPELPAR